MAQDGKWLAGKTAVITGWNQIIGSSSGIGAEIAREFAALGCALVITGRNVDNLMKVKAECVKKGLAEDKILTCPADLMKNEDIKNLVTQAQAKFPKIDFLINNAGTGAKDASISGNDLDVMHSIMMVNLVSVVKITKLLIPSIVKSKGAIVNIGSVLGQIATSTFGYYSMSKAALEMFSKSLALELAPFGVRVNTVAPGLTATNFLKQAGFNDAEDKKIFEYGASRIPLGRVGQPSDVSSMVFHLCSDFGAYITGQVYNIDGGESILHGEPLKTVLAPANAIEDLTAKAEKFLGSLLK